MARRNVFRIHAVQRMNERGITVREIHEALETGTVIETYPDDTPYPSRLILAWRGPRPIHVVVADNPQDDETIVITAYEPNPNQWDSAFSRRRT